MDLSIHYQETNKQLLLLRFFNKFLNSWRYKHIGFMLLVELVARGGGDVMDILS
jgi:hypothetical protein